MARVLPVDALEDDLPFPLAVEDERRLAAVAAGSLEHVARRRARQQMLLQRPSVARS